MHWACPAQTSKRSNSRGKKQQQQKQQQQQQQQQQQRQQQLQQQEQQDREQSNNRFFRRAIPVPLLSHLLQAPVPLQALVHRSEPVLRLRGTTQCWNRMRRHRNLQGVANIQHADVFAIHTQCGAASR